MSETIHQMPEDERPRERLLQLGTDALSTVELLSIVMGSGTRGKSVLALSTQVLARFENLDGIGEASTAELASIKGIGEAKAARLKAALELAFRLRASRPKKRCEVRTAGQAYEIVRDVFAGEKQELLVAILIDQRGQAIRHEIVAKGGATMIAISPSEVYRAAIRHGAVALLVAHNHPSGVPEPSISDLIWTEQLIAAGKIVGVRCDDHLVVGESSFCSIRDRHPRLWWDEADDGRSASRQGRSHRASSEANPQPLRSPHRPSQREACHSRP